MGRRLLLLTALGLAACVADLPTEPTLTAVEGATFLAAPPPPPPPPATYSAGLEGGNGFPSSVELGFYDAPVFVKVTITGVLSYSGPPSGYLPGTGQIDARGKYIGPQNLCSLLVQVRWVQANGSNGSTGPGGGCPDVPTQITSYISYALIAGAVSTYRNAGPPLSCWKYPAPCTSITGSQTISVEPENGRLLLTPNKTLVGPGGGITINAKGVWGAHPEVTVPMSVREWRWEGSGPEVGGGHTKVCAAYNTNQCIVQVFQSGNVVLEALVNGVVKTERVWIAVTGGDSLPPQPPDTVPQDSIPTDTIPTDTIPGGGGGGCSAVILGSTSGAVSECPPPEEDTPVVIASCLPTQPTRGEAVTCRVQLEKGGAFTLTKALAHSDGHDILAQLPPGPVENFVWGGIAVARTEVEFELDVVTPTGPVHLGATSSFDVSAREWAPLLLPTVPPLAHRYQLDPDKRMTLTPVQGQTFTLGLFAPARLNMADLPSIPVQSGPNAGFVIFSVPATIPRPNVWTHPGLRSGPWYNDQNGGRIRGGTGSRCTQTALPKLEGLIDIHEGMTMAPNSHWGIAQDLLEFARLQPRIEELRDFSSSPRDLQLSAQRIYSAVWDRIVAAQFDFEDPDYARIFGSLGCALDMDPSPADG